MLLLKLSSCSERAELLRKRRAGSWEQVEDFNSNIKPSPQAAFISLSFPLTKGTAQPRQGVAGNFDLEPFYQKG